MCTFYSQHLPPPLQHPLVSALSLSRLSSSSGRATPHMSPSFPPSPRRLIPPTLLYKVVISLEPELSLGTVRSPAGRCPQVSGAGEAGRKSVAPGCGDSTLVSSQIQSLQGQRLSLPHIHLVRGRKLYSSSGKTLRPKPWTSTWETEVSAGSRQPRPARLCLGPPTSHPAGTSHPWRERPDHRGGPSS